MTDDYYEYGYQIDSLLDQIYDLKDQLQAQVDIQNAHLLRALKIAGVVVND